MIEIIRSRQIKATPHAIFTAISDPTQLAMLLPRVRKVDVLEQHANYARIATHMAFDPFGTIRNEGEARWQTDREVSFISRKPLLVETHWQLTPVVNGTEVTVQLKLDLAPLIGPFAAFVPADQVNGMVGPELDSALDALAKQIEQAES